jgi:aldehyde:ferredoxin oxidoreductase
VESGPYAIEEAQKPEYETLGAFGGMCLNNNLESIIMCNDICNKYGLDTISAGCTVAYAIECYENGILTKHDTDGLELTWGNHAAIVALTDKMAKREGLGDILADGVKVAAEKIGQGSEEYAVHIHGQELPMHDPRLSQTREAQLPVLGIMYQIDATPGRHTASSSNRGRVVNASGLCSMGGRVFRGEALVEFLTAVTGIEYTADDLEQMGERIACIRQAFNLREGYTPKDFRLHGRVIGDPPLERGPLAGITLDMDTATRDYFEGMGWEPETGKPSKERLMELGGFEDVIADLY